MKKIRCNMKLILILVVSLFTVSLARLNKKIKKSAYLPTVKYADLTPTQIFTITRIQRLTSNFGPAIVVDLNGEHSMFLPKRTVETFDGPEGAEDFSYTQAAVAKGKLGFVKNAIGDHEFVDL